MLPVRYRGKRCKTIFLHANCKVSNIAVLAQRGQTDSLPSGLQILLDTQGCRYQHGIRGFPSEVQAVSQLYAYACRPMVAQPLLCRALTRCSVLAVESSSPGRNPSDGHLVSCFLVFTVSF
jgi:hypothetical protein